MSYGIGAAAKLRFLEAKACGQGVRVRSALL